MTAAPLADVLDVEDALGRPLTDVERGAVEHALRLATALVRAEVPALDARLRTGALDVLVVGAVVAAMVARVVRNPDGARGSSRTAGPFTEYTQWDADGVGLQLLEHERRVLLPRPRTARGIGSLRLRAGLGWP